MNNEDGGVSLFREFTLVREASVDRKCVGSLWARQGEVADAVEDGEGRVQRRYTRVGGLTRLDDMAEHRQDCIRSRHSLSTARSSRFEQRWLTSPIRSFPGSYRSAISAYNELRSPSPILTLYAARSHLALSPPSISYAEGLLSSIPSTLDSRAVSSLATYLSGSTEEAVGDLEELLAELGEQGLEEDDEGRFVRGVVGTVWILEGEERREEGIEVLREAVELGKDQEW